MSRFKKTTWLAFLAGSALVLGTMPGLCRADDASDAKAAVVDFVKAISKGDADSAKKLLIDANSVSGQFADALAGVCKSYTDFDDAANTAYGKGKEADPKDLRAQMVRSMQNATATAGADGTATVSPGGKDELKLKKVDGSWKIAEAISEEDFKHVQPFFAAFKTVTVTVVADIKAGKFTSRDDAEKSLQSRIEAEVEKLTPAPAAPTAPTPPQP